MSRRAGPSVKSRRLAILLRRLRAASGLSAAEVSRQTEMSASKVNRMENAEIGFYLDDLEKILDFYRVSARRRVEIMDIARHAEQRGWLRMTAPNMPADWQTWVDFEDEASGIQDYAPLMIPGLLQTPEYAKAIIQATGNGLSPDEVDARVASRMARQGVLSRSEPLRLRVILNESILEQPFASPGAQARQLRRLADSAGQDHVTIQVVPREAGLHPGFVGGFTILEYDDEASLVLLENTVSSLFLDEEEHIDVYTQAWATLGELSHGPDESVELIAAAAARLS
ncbi:helix-turn-helix transcriptional regulator [Amycolatopsis minnesotensis]|uniref:Helix-turn-helix transcriptional regulator n=1 Tax=Amycolatopsis minnesotensis TaxID=337894 RepID=A0ABP5DA03_9PSEU